MTLIIDRIILVPRFRTSGRVVRVECFGGNMVQRKAQAYAPLRDSELDERQQRPQHQPHILLGHSVRDTQTLGGFNSALSRIGHVAINMFNGIHADPWSRSQLRARSEASSVSCNESTHVCKFGCRPCPRVAKHHQPPSRLSN